MKQLSGLGLLFVVVALVLVACGDSTATLSPTTAPAITTQTATTPVATTIAPVTTGAPTTSTTATTQVATTAPATTSAAATATTVASITAAATTPGATINSSSATQYPLTITDLSGTNLTFTKKPERIVCIQTFCLDLLLELGLLPAGMMDTLYPSVTGSYFERPEFYGDKLKAVTSIKSTNFAPDLEDTAKFKPDLIIGWTSNGVALREPLKTIAPIYTVSAGSLADIYASLRGLAKITDRQAQAEVAIKHLEDKVTAYKAKSPKTKTVLYSPGFAFTAVYSARSSVGEVLSQVTKYPFDFPGDTATGRAQFSLEKILQVDPEVIFIGTFPGNSAYAKPLEEQKAKLKDDPFWKELKAFKTNQVYEVDFNIWSGWGTKALSLMLDDAMPKLYPDVFPKALP
jgi:iron complex transport system substrate-binding protein